MVPENNISFLICNVANLRRQQGLLSNVSTILFLDGEFSDKIDALGAPALENMWRQTRVGTQSGEERTNFIACPTSAVSTSRGRKKRLTLRLKNYRVVPKRWRRP